MTSKTVRQDSGRPSSQFRPLQKSGPVPYSCRPVRMSRIGQKGSRVAQTAGCSVHGIFNIGVWIVDVKTIIHELVVCGPFSGVDNISNSNDSALGNASGIIRTSIRCDAPISRAVNQPVNLTHPVKKPKTCPRRIDVVARTPQP